MWEILKINRNICREFRAALEDGAELTAARGYADLLAALPPSLGQHAATCSRCQSAGNTFLASRALLAALPVLSDTPDSSFVSRVMAKIAAREDQLRWRVDSWTAAVPRLAARLTWATSAALLLASFVLYEGHISAPSQPAPALSVSTTTPDYIFEPTTPANKDEVLSTLLER